MAITPPPEDPADDLPALARRIATDAHAGQVDRAGVDYITHPARVATRVAALGPLVEATAWLHDVLEDTPVTAADLLAAGIPGSVVAAVELLSRPDGEPYADFIERIATAGNPTAVAVKLADLADNTDLARAASGTDALRARYAAAKARLGAVAGDGTATAARVPPGGRS